MQGLPIPQIFMDYHWFARISTDLQGFLQICKDFYRLQGFPQVCKVRLRFARITTCLQGFLQVCKDFNRFAKITTDLQKLPQTCRDYHRFAGITNNIWDLRGLTRICKWIHKNVSKLWGVPTMINIS